MKKLLIGAGALVAPVALAASAGAAEKIKLSVGGFGSAVISYADSDRVDGTFDIKGDNEIHFKGKTTLDNGLSVSVKYELEAGSAGDDNSVDEWNITVGGAFGQLVFGGDDTALVNLAVYGPPHYGGRLLGAGSYDGDSFDDMYMDLPTAQSEVFGPVSYTYMNTGDAGSITYYTPQFNGFTLGVSYQTADEEDQNSQPLVNDGYFWGAIVKYSGEISEVSVDASLGYGDKDNDAGSNGWQSALELGYRGFKFGGSYGHFSDVDMDGDSHDAWNAGVGYETGPYGVGLAYSYGEQENSGSKDTEFELWQLTSEYKLGPGMVFGAGVAFADVENGYRDGAQVADEDGWAAATGLTLSF